MTALGRLVVPLLLGQNVSIAGITHAGDFLAGQTRATNAARLEVKNSKTLLIFVVLPPHSDLERRV